LALTLAITSTASGSPVAGATVSVTGGAVTQLPCSGSCEVFGYGGTYELDITAPGFQPTHRSIRIHGTMPDCGCATTDTQHLSVALVPTSP
jgi:hypothetical protein